MSTLWIVALGAFLVAHGLIHLGYLTPAPTQQQPGAPRYPFVATNSWMSHLGAPSTGLKVGAVALALVTIGLYALAAASLGGLIIPKSAFGTLVIAGSSASLLLLVLYWDVWFIAGVAIDAALIAAVWFYDLPARVGAFAPGGA